MIARDALTHPVSFVARQTRKAIEATVTLREAQKHPSSIHVLSEDWTWQVLHSPNKSQSILYGSMVAWRCYLSSRLSWHSPGTISTSTTLPRDSRWHSYPPHNKTPVYWRPWTALNQLLTLLPALPGGPIKPWTPLGPWRRRKREKNHETLTEKEALDVTYPKNTRVSARVFVGCCYLRSWVATFSFVTSTSWISLKSTDGLSPKNTHIFYPATMLRGNKKKETFGKRYVCTHMGSRTSSESHWTRRSFKSHLETDTCSN